MATLFKAALLVCIVTSEPNREISRCFAISTPYTGDMLIDRTIYYRYLFRRYVIVRHGNQVEVNLSPDDLLEETMKSLPNFKETRQQMSGRLENQWKAFSIPKEVADFLIDQPRDNAGALKSIPSRYRTDGDEGDWEDRIIIWMKYSYLGVEDCPKSKDFRTLQIDGILNALWCYWKRFEEIAPHATILPAEQPHWDISKCIKLTPAPNSNSKFLARLYRRIYWRYTTAIYDYTQVNLSLDDFHSEITKILPHYDSTGQLSKKVEYFSNIPNELAEFLKGYSGIYKNALKAIPLKFRTDGDEDHWLNRIAVWMHYSAFGVERYTDGSQTLKSNGIRNFLWCVWQGFEEQSIQAAPAATLAKRPIDEPEETFTPAAKQLKTTETTEPSHTVMAYPVRHRRPILAAPILVHADIPPRRKENVVEETDPLAVADALLAMKYH